MKRYISPIVTITLITPANQILGASTPIINANFGIHSSGAGGSVEYAM
ncbi:MAG: hypothetical protein MJZ53_00165 [Paludibacteraceae bacterium]|nr:hypothetical protein [Paludibacteraceae bacterium]